MTQEIELTRGKVALVDDADHALIIAAGPWHAIQSNNTCYARHSATSNVQVLMHNLLTGWPRVDHRNRDGLDNRRANLRPATHAQNIQNSECPRGVSGFRGVYPRESGRWAARLQAGHQTFYFGTHDTPEQAARAYDAAAITHFGEFARLNFPMEIAS